MGVAVEAVWAVWSAGALNYYLAGVAILVRVLPRLGLEEKVGVSTLGCIARRLGLFSMTGRKDTPLGCLEKGLSNRDRRRGCVYYARVDLSENERSVGVTVYIDLSFPPLQR